MRVAVVGGGIIGLCVGEALARRGADVVLLEAGDCGGAASAGNAGWITPGIASPLPAPGTVPQALRWMLNPRSPLLVRPVLRTSFVHWLYDFWRSTRPRRYSAGLAAMVAFAGRAFADYEALAERCSFEMHSQGLLFVARKSASLRSELEILRDHQRLGYRGDFSLLGPEEVADYEPALGGEIAGAVLAPRERHVRPETVTTALVARLAELGAEVREKTAVHGVLSSGGGWRLDCEGNDAIEVDQVVLACGVATAALLRPHGVRLPLEGAKGYSITVDAPRTSPRGPIYLIEPKVGISPYEGALRLAGTLELGSRGLALSKGRVASIERAGRSSLRGWGDTVKRQVWAGFRSLLPDGLPAIGPVPGQVGLHVATGHAMLGVTLAPTTAEALAPVVLDGGPSLELAPFSIARFDNRGSNAVVTRGGAVQRPMEGINE